MSATPIRTTALGGITLRQRSVSAMDNNVYLLTDETSGEQLLVDAADDPTAIDELVLSGTGRLDLLVTTHSHWDHVRALAAVAERWGPLTMAGAADADDLPLSPDRTLADGDTIELGATPIQVIGLRGHTPGGVALACPAADGTVHLLVGDSLFPGGVGATGNPGQSFDQLYADVGARLFERFPDSTVVHPGHGTGTTLGRERPHLAAWRARGW